MEITKTLKGKFLDLITGVCIGDTVGVPYEFKKKTAIIPPFNNIGGGPFNLEKGQLSDDSELSIIVMDTVLYCIRKDFTYIKNSYLNIQRTKYLAWYNTNPPDIGNTIRSALINIKSKKKITGSNTSKSNGALMRISPLGILSMSLKNREIYELVKIEVGITHTDKFVIDICYVYCKIIKYILLNHSMEYIKNKVFKLSKNIMVNRIINSSFTSPEPVNINDKLIYTDDPTFMGYIGIAFKNCLFELFNGTSFNTSINNIIQRGGDTDTNATIAGAILGLYYRRNNINEEWRHNLEYSVYNRKDTCREYSYGYITNKINNLEEFEY